MKYFHAPGYSHHSQDSPLIALIVQEEQEFLVMLTLTNWFVSLFHTLLKVGQSLDVLENPSSVPATFPTDNNPSCYSEKSLDEKKKKEKEVVAEQSNPPAIQREEDQSLCPSDLLIVKL